jgi:hypothetical protein
MPFGWQYTVMWYKKFFVVTKLRPVPQHLFLTLNSFSQICLNILYDAKTARGHALLQMHKKAYLHKNES